MYDKFKNSDKFRAKCHDTGEKCPKCGNSIIEIERKKVNEKVSQLFGFYCVVCDHFMFGLIEWAIKNQSK
jgi:uncharacterized protein with PIN domain